MLRCWSEYHTSIYSPGCSICHPVSATPPVPSMCFWYKWLSAIMHWKGNTISLSTACASEIHHKCMLKADCMNLQGRTLIKYVRPRTQTCVRADEKIKCFTESYSATIKLQSYSNIWKHGQRSDTEATVSTMDVSSDNNSLLFPAYIPAVHSSVLLLSFSLDRSVNIYTKSISLSDSLPFTLRH